MHITRRAPTLLLVDKAIMIGSSQVFTRTSLAPITAMALIAALTSIQTGLTSRVNPSSIISLLYRLKSSRHHQILNIELTSSLPICLTPLRRPMALPQGSTMVTPFWISAHYWTNQFRALIQCSPTLTLQPFSWMLSTHSITPQLLSKMRSSRILPLLNSIREVNLSSLIWEVSLTSIKVSIW